MKQKRFLAILLLIPVLLVCTGCDLLSTLTGGGNDADKDLSNILSGVMSTIPTPAPASAPVPETSAGPASPAAPDKIGGPAAAPAAPAPAPAETPEETGGVSAETFADLMLFTHNTDFSKDSTRPTLLREDDGTAILEYVYEEDVLLQFCRYPGTYEDEEDGVKVLIKGKLDDQRDATVAEMEVDGRRAWRVYFDYMEYGVTMRSASAIVLDQGWLYVFFTSTHADKFDRYEEDIDAILYSLRLVQAEKLFGRWADTAFDEYAPLVAGLWTAENPYNREDPYMFFFTEDGRFYETYAAFDNRGVYSEWGVTDRDDTVSAYNKLSEGSAYRTRADTGEVLYCIRTNLSFDGDSTVCPMELDKSLKELRILQSGYTPMYLYPLNTAEGAAIVQGTKYERLASEPEEAQEEEPQLFAYLTLQNANIGKERFIFRLEPMDLIGWNELDRLADYGIDPDTYDLDYALLPMKDAEVLYLEADKYGADTAYEAILEEDGVFSEAVDPGTFVEAVTERAMHGNGEGMFVTYKADGDFLTYIAEFYVP